jgi:hypothetical protein
MGGESPADDDCDSMPIFQLKPSFSPTNACWHVIGYCFRFFRVAPASLCLRRKGLWIPREKTLWR